MKILFSIFLIFVFISSDHPASFFKNVHYTVISDSTKSDSVKTFEKPKRNDYNRSDFKILMEEFCTDKPISVQELRENRTAPK